MAMLMSALGKGFQGAGKALNAKAEQPGPQLTPTTIPINAPQQTQIQPTRTQNLSDAVQNLNVANQLAQQQQNTSISAKLNAQPMTSIPGAGQDAQLGDISAMAGRTAHTAAQFAGPGNAAQQGAAAGQAAYNAGQPGGIGVSAAQLANAQAMVQQDTRDEQAAQEKLRGVPSQSPLGMSQDQAQTMRQTQNYIDANSGVPGNILGSGQNMSQAPQVPNQSAYPNDLYQSSLAFR